MDFRMRISIFCCLAACLFMIAVPLVSEATYRGRGGEAVKPVTDSVIYVDVVDTVTEETMAVPDTEAIDTFPFDSETNESITVTVLDTSTGENRLMALDEYITYVVAAEMPYTFHSEALKAQAVAARSYCLYKMENGLTHDGGADICTSYSHCAAYVSAEELEAKYGSSTAKRIIKKVREAVEATSGEIITYQGKPALALFHARSWQYTESSANVWGGKLPYLISVSTPELDSISTVTISDRELKTLFSSSSAISVSVGTEGRLTSEKNDTGRQAYLFYGNSGLKAKKLRTLLGLRSCDFEYEKTTDGWLFTVHGYGHGVGMSQYGANTMAIDGFSYSDILTHYYTGVQLQTIGAIS